MDKEITDKLREQNVKKRGKKRFKRAKGTQLTQVEQVAQRRIEKEDKTKFNEAWFATFIKVIGKRFHNNFRTSYQAHPLGYMGFGL